MVIWVLVGLFVIFVCDFVLQFFCIENDFVFFVIGLFFDIKIV